MKFLLTLSLGGVHYLHGYLECEDKKYTETAINRLVQLGESMYVLRAPIILLTPLDEAGAAVVETVIARLENASEKPDKPGTWGMCVWTLDDGSEDNKAIMGLH